MPKSKTITVEGVEITVSNHQESSYISLTDIAKGKDGSDLIKSWMRSKYTIEYLGTWEGINNPDFKGDEFVTFMAQAGRNTFNMTPSKWVKATGAVGIISRPGKNGGTFAHKDIAYEFASWLSPKFKLFLIKEFDRLKEIEQKQNDLNWSVKRTLAKVGYHIQTDAVKTHIIPVSRLPRPKQGIEYANEADVLNIALFGKTAKQWRIENPNLHKQGRNIRDTASINELYVLNSIETLNAIMIQQKMPRGIRAIKLGKIVDHQLTVLNQSTNFLDSLKRTAEDMGMNDEDQKLLG